MIDGQAQFSLVLATHVGLVVGCLPSGSIHMSLHHLAVMTQLSGIPILSPALFMHPYFKFKECSLKSMCIPSFVLIGGCVSELHAHLCPYQRVGRLSMYI